MGRREEPLVRRSLRALLAFALLLLGVALLWVVFTFGSQNAHWVIVRIPTLQWQWENPFPNIEYEARLWLVMLTCVLVGFCLALPIFLFSSMRRGMERRRERRFIKGLEAELVDLRNLPVTNPAPLEDVPEDPIGDRQRGLLAPTSIEEDERELLEAALKEPPPRSGG
jgi:hypothetical protein